MALRLFRTNPNESAAQEDDLSQALENEIKQARALIEKCRNQLFKLNVTYGNIQSRKSEHAEIYKRLSSALADLTSADFKLLPLDPAGAVRYHYGMGIQAEQEGYNDDANFHFSEVQRYQAEVDRRKRS